MTEQLHPSAIAVVGLSCRFPGARGEDSYWANLRAGVESIRRFTPQELLAAGVERSVLESPRYVRAAPVLEGVELFDAPFFGFSPRQAVLTDPQQRLLLECAHEALEDSGFHPARLGGAVGVFASSSLSHYLLAHLGHTQRVAGSPDSLPAYLGNDKDYLATQVAYQLDLRGPAVSVQTACSSSLVAVHLACQALLGGECELALAGASVVRVPRVAGYLYEEEGIFSPDGHCRPFDAQARGTLFGSGVGVVALKRLERALADGDRIRAVIRGTAINNDGARKVAYHAPSMDGQAAAISEALMLAGVEPDSVSYVEAHGTGTLLGDPLEVAALTRVFRASTSRRGFCALGSVKGNLGHLENAAGMAALLKTVLALEHRELPASLHFHTPNPHIDFESSPFRVNAALTPWAQGPTPRRAGVSAFGMGGTNAHVVLEEAPPPRPAPRRRAGEAWLLPLSARGPEALRALAGRYQAWLPTSTAEPGDVAHTASVRRQHHPHRVAVVGRTREELAERLGALARGEVRAGPAAAGTAPRLAFLFPGQGSQWLGMGRELLASEPAFRQALERCESALRPHLRHSPREVLEGSGALLEELDLVQPTLFAVQVALAELWRSWGVQPDVVVGHSMGEVAAACVAGALGLEDAARVIALRSRLALRVRGQGTMAVVGLTLEEARQALRGLEDRLSVAVSSSPRSTVLSGEARALEEVLASLQARNVFTGRIKVDFASHSPQVEPLLAELRQLLSGLRPRAASTAIFSTVEGALVDGSRLGADYWARNLREPVLFSSAIEHLSASGGMTFLEVGPHPILLPAVEQVLAHHGRQGAVVGSLRREQPERAALLESLGSLYSLGHSVRLERLHPEGGAPVRLPSYPWQHQRYWPEEEEARTTGWQPAGAHPLLGQRLRSPLAQAQYERRWSARSPAFVAEHQVLGQPVVPGAALALAALAAARNGAATPMALEQVELQELLALPVEQGARTVQVLVGPRGSEPATVQVLSVGEEESRGWVLHASGRLQPYTPEPPASPWRSGPVRERCAQPLEGTALAGLLRAAGVELGPSLRWLEQLWLGEGEALGELRAPTAAETAPEVGWVDACFQLAGLAAGGAQALRAGALYLPVRLAHLHLAEGTGPAVYAHARVQPGSNPAPGAEELVGDVELWDEAGQRVALARGVVVRRVERAALERSLGGSEEPWLHELVWRPLTAPATPARSERGRWLLLADEGPLGQALARALQARGESCTVALPGERLQRLDAGLYRVNLRDPQELARLLAEAEGAPLPWRAAVYLVGAEPAAREQSAQALAAEVERTTGGLLRLAQALASQPRAPRLWVATRGTQPVTEAAVVPAQAALWGLGRTLSQEHPELWGGLVDVEASAQPEQAMAGLLECVESSQEEQLALRGGQRYVPRLVRVARERVPTMPLRVHPEATYLVTGGFGGLGQAVARLLVERGARHLVLLGRHTGGVEALEALGARVVSARVDVADEQALARLVDEVSRTLPPLRGVIHSAGVLEDGVLLQQDEERLARALAPKVRGALHLHQLTRGLELDFFALFSSSAALLGPTGQGPHAAANAFLGALAHARRAAGLPATTIDWSAWSEVGQAAAYAELARSAGITPLSPAQGLRALEAALALGQPQVGVLPVQWARYARSRGRPLPLLAELVPVTAPPSPATPELVRRLRALPASSRRAHLVAHLQALVSSLLGLEPSKPPEPEAGFFSLGMDSLRVITLKNRLQEELGHPLASSLVFNHPSAAALGEYLEQELFGSPPPPPAPSAPAAPAGPQGLAAQLEAHIDELSEAEAEALLMGRLASLEDSQS